MVVKRRRTRPTLITRNASDSASSSPLMLKEQGKSLSVSSMQGTRSEHKRSVASAVDFAPQDALHTYSESPPPLSELECRNCFYTKEDINRFDRDRALTILMYRTRKGSSVAWDDNVHSLRGLEEMITKPGEKRTRTDRRKEHRRAVLKEEERLSNASVKAELNIAAVGLQKTERELRAELIRGVSCSHSKIDRQRAIGYGQKDERAAGRGSSSTRKLLEKLKLKFNGWASASNRSLLGSDRESLSGDEPERTS